MALINLKHVNKILGKLWNNLWFREITESFLEFQVFIPESYRFWSIENLETLAQGTGGFRPYAPIHPLGKHLCTQTAQFNTVAETASGY
jgi:hypothetical protein